MKWMVLGMLGWLAAVLIAVPLYAKAFRRARQQSTPVNPDDDDT